MTTEQKAALEVVAWSKVSKAHMPRMRMLNESYLQGAWDVPLVRLADHEAALLAKEAECEALRKDAERYRWIKADEGAQFRVVQLSVAGYLYDQEIDSAIDAALVAAKGAK